MPLTKQTAESAVKIANWVFLENSDSGAENGLKEPKILRGVMMEYSSVFLWIFLTAKIDLC